MPINPFTPFVDNTLAEVGPVNQRLDTLRLGHNSNEALINSILSGGFNSGVAQSQIAILSDIKSGMNIIAGYNAIIIVYAFGDNWSVTFSDGSHLDMDSSDNGYLTFYDAEGNTVVLIDNGVVQLQTFVFPASVIVDSVTGNPTQNQGVIWQKKWDIASILPELTKSEPLLSSRPFDFIPEGDLAALYTLQGLTIDKETKEQALDLIEYDFNRAYSSGVQSITYTLGNVGNVLQTMTIPLYVAPNGRRIALPDQFDLVDELFTQTDTAWIWKYDPDTDVDNPTCGLPINNNGVTYTNNKSYVGDYEFDASVPITGNLVMHPMIAQQNADASTTALFSPNNTTASSTYVWTGTSASSYRQTRFDSSKVVNTGDRVRERSIVLPLYFRTS